MISPAHHSLCTHRNIGLRIAFDGSEYNGWQSQPNARTIEDSLHSAISRFEQRDDVKLIGASRTDSGVHATGQYANFCSRRTTISADKYAAALNQSLPSSITVLSSDELPASFHARYSAKKRTYLYTILVSRSMIARSLPRLPYSSLARYVTRSHMPSFSQCNRALASLCGTHDFKGFAKIDSATAERSTVRTIFEAAIYPQGNLVQIKISANAFLRTMVRSIVGTILDNTRCNPTYIQKILYTGDRTLCGEVAPAHGLCLDWVAYE